MSRGAGGRTVLVACLVGAGWLGACSRVPVVEVRAEPAPTASEPTGEPTPSPTPTTSPEPTTSPTPTAEGPRQPTDGDRGEFVAGYAPEDAVDLEHVASDVDGDGELELVFAYARDGERAHVEIAWWTGTDYEIRFAGDGGEATAIERLQVADVNGDALVEVVTFQRGSGSSASATVWRVTGAEQVEEVVADGGCHDGSHTYGVVGVEFRDDDGDGADEIEATCDGSPLPRSAWPTHTYVWQGDTYHHVPDEVP